MHLTLPNFNMDPHVDKPHMDRSVNEMPPFYPALSACSQEVLCHLTPACCTLWGLLLNPAKTLPQSAEPPQDIHAFLRFAQPLIFFRAVLSPAQPPSQPNLTQVPPIGGPGNLGGREAATSEGGT
ncbi:hypothetical protein PCANC_07420 [Puccinia coronata f. sp. avenae]|uniref:Uncharacterized protein n=1 Tax=Puccinia coronata f. sp. avenae TaxID=200324 RepID=A0A2N5T440_9BASI|nr:hypothetical protein PCANC_07420 [Puccinia coronata f. sp. avenae]